MRRATAAAAAVLAIASTPAVATAARAGARREERPPPSAVFNVPSGSIEEQDAIGAHLDALAAATPPGAEIRIALYRLTSPVFTQTLLDAFRRGVRVRLVLDQGARREAAYGRLAAALGTSRKRASWVTTCHQGCIGDGIMHNKFFLFSRTGSARDVVVQSSANLTTTNRVNAWNNALTVHDPAIYRAYARYFAALAAQRHGHGHQVTRSGRLTLYTFPRAGRTRKSDTLYGLLGHVGCAAHTAVHVTVFTLTRTAIAERLASLARQGCDVRIIYTNLGRHARKVLTRGPHLLSSHYVYPDFARADVVEAYAHSKYLTIGGTYAGHGRRLVVTGSPNYTEPALRDNDEAMLKVEDASIYAAYENNFQRLWRTAKSRAPLNGRVKEK